MFILGAKLVFYIAHVHSLKGKRQISRRLIDKTRNRFNVSIAEVDTQDMHQSLTIGVAVVSGDHRHAHTMLNAVINYLEDHAEGDLISIEKY